MCAQRVRRSRIVVSIIRRVRSCMRSINQGEPRAVAYSQSMSHAASAWGRARGDHHIASAQLTR